MLILSSFYRWRNSSSPGSQLVSGIHCTRSAWLRTSEFLLLLLLRMFFLCISTWLLLLILQGTIPKILPQKWSTWTWTNLLRQCQVSPSKLLFSRSVISDSLRPLDCSTPRFPILHHLLEHAQTHVHWVGDAIQPSCPLSSPSPASISWSHPYAISPYSLGGLSPITRIKSVSGGRLHLICCSNPDASIS